MAQPTICLGKDPKWTPVMVPHWQHIISTDWTYLEPAWQNIPFSARQVPPIIVRIEKRKASTSPIHVRRKYNQYSIQVLLTNAIFMCYPSYNEKSSSVSSRLLVSSTLSVWRVGARPGFLLDSSGRLRFRLTGRNAEWGLRGTHHNTYPGRMSIVLAFKLQLSRTAVDW